LRPSGPARMLFPALAQLAQQKVTTLSEPEQFHGLITQIFIARDEKTVREVLSM
jgi:hypothetical protein